MSQLDRLYKEAVENQQRTRPGGPIKSPEENAQFMRDEHGSYWDENSQNWQKFKPRTRPEFWPQRYPEHFKDAVNTRGMDPDSHAYYVEDSFSPYDSQNGNREWDPNTGYQPSDYDEQQSELVGEDDDSGYNWGPEPDGDLEGPGPDPNFVDDRPHPFGTPMYSPRKR